MKFNEWMTQNNKDHVKALNTSADLGMQTTQEDDLLKSQMEQWVNKLAGLLHTVPSDKRNKLLEKVIHDINAI